MTKPIKVITATSTSINYEGAERLTVADSYLTTPKESLDGFI